MRNDISLELASRLTEQVKTAFENGSLLDAVTPVTQDLLKFWFMGPYTEERSKNFHEGQKQSILNIIYLHEVLQVTTVEEIYRQVAPDLLAECNLSDLAKDKMYWESVSSTRDFTNISRLIEPMQDITIGITYTFGGKSRKYAEETVSDSFEMGDSRIVKQQMKRRGK